MTNQPKIGIVNLKKGVGLSIALAEQADASGKDGWSAKDIFDFLDELLQLPAVLNNAKAIGEEANDLDAEETKEINDYITVEYDIPNDHTEEVVQDSAAVLVAIAKLRATIVKARAAKSATKE